MSVSRDTPAVEKIATAHVEEQLGHGATDEAKHASDLEHQATFRESFSKHRWAIFWSCIISLAVVMEGYDTILMGNFWAYPRFGEKYGHFVDADTGYIVNAKWQSALNMGSTVGAIFGALFNGWATAKWGYKPVTIGGLFFLNAFIFIVFFAPSKAVLLVGQITCGLTWYVNTMGKRVKRGHVGAMWPLGTLNSLLPLAYCLRQRLTILISGRGIFATTGPAYASEVMPLQLRGYLTMYVNLCWAMGQFIAAGVLKGLVNNKTQWAYRIPFAIQWVWPVPLMVIIYFAPESPWYYTRTDRLEEAKRSLKRLSDYTEAEVNGVLAMLVHTVKIESETTAGTSYLDCFKGTDLRRTEIAMMAFCGQILAGSSFAYSPAYFFTAAGIDASKSFGIGLGGTAFAFVGTICAWFVTAKVGRRTIYIFGECMSCLWLIIIGSIAAGANEGPGLWAQAAIALIWIFTYAITVGPVAYSIVAEISAVRLRAQTVVLARNAYQIVNIASQILVPHMLNAESWNWQGKTGFFWAGTSACVAVWAYFRLPEPRGRTYEELDILFAKGVSARNFSKTEVDPYAEAYETEGKH